VSEIRRSRGLLGDAACSAVIGLRPTMTGFVSGENNCPKRCSEDCRPKSTTAVFIRLSSFSHVHPLELWP
jgi:hypothetical protein